MVAQEKVKTRVHMAKFALCYINFSYSLIISPLSLFSYLSQRTYLLQAY